MSTYFLLFIIFFSGYAYLTKTIDKQLILNDINMILLHFILEHPLYVKAEAFFERNIKKRTVKKQ